MQHRRGWPVSEIVFIVLATVLVATGLMAQANFVVSVELGYEVEGLDLDTDTVSELLLLEHFDPLDNVAWDVLVAYNSDRVPHAVLAHNAGNGTTVSFLSGIPFESVTYDTVADLTFTADLVDQPLGADDTVVVKTDTGTFFKIGHATPTTGGVVFDYQRLEDLFTENPTEPDESSVMLARNDPTAPPEGLSAEDWEQIQALIRESEYRVTRQEGEVPGFEARNTEHHLRMQFEMDGVHIAPHGAGEWQWHLALEGYGYENEVRKAAKAQLVADGNRVEYRRGDLIEWYVNDGGGLEQGFTLARPPEGERKGALSLRLASSGSLAPVVEDGSGVRFVDGAGTTVLRYAGLLALDATERELPAHLAAVAGGLVIEVDDEGAVYPLTIDPTVVHEDAKLTASDGEHYWGFGDAVAVSGDTAVVGAPGSSHTTCPLPAPNGCGAAYVFVRSGTTWTEQAKLTASDAAIADYFGFTVALSGDIVEDPTAGGATIVVGARADDSRYRTNAGSAYVFVWNGTSWTEQAKLTASDRASNDYFGYSATLSGDTAVVGAVYDRHAGFYFAGSAYVFVRSGTTWTEQAKLTASDAAERSYFGHSVALSGDTAVVGARGASHTTCPVPASPGCGSAYVFVRGTTWTEQAKLTASDAGSNDQFGNSVALSGDTAVVGAYLNYHPDGYNVGAAYVFVRSSTTWTEQAKLTASDAAVGDGLGGSVAVWGDTAVVGANGEDHGGAGWAGAAYVFVRGGTTWTEQAKLISSVATPNSRLGSSVAVWDDTAMVGTRENNIGSAYVFSLNQAPVALCRDITVEADGECRANVNPEEIDDGSYDPDGDPISFELAPSGPYMLGETIVTLMVTDDPGASGTCTATVTVVDTTPPSLSVSMTPDTLWPPNHRMIDVQATVVASDNCGTPEVILLLVASSEPDDTPGTGDGNTVDDIQGVDLGTADYEFSLRAERSASGDGRVYTATYTAIDGSGNETTAAAMVDIPHDQGGRTDPLDTTAQDNSVGTVLVWALVEGASHYNVIRGDLVNIAETEAAIDLGPIACIEVGSLDLTTEGWDDLQIPALGKVFFYLVEYDNGIRSSYGTESASKPRVVQSGDCE